MKINLGLTLMGFDGKPLLDSDGKALVLKDVLVNALVASAPKDVIDGVAKLRRYEMALKINQYKNNDAYLFTAEDVVLLKDLVGKHYAIIVSGQVWKMLESNDE